MPEKLISITSYIFTFIWGLTITLSFIGWGKIINQIMLPKQQFQWGQKACLGIALSIFIGGILNLTWTISKTTILLYLIIGLLSALINIYQIRKPLINSLLNYINQCRQDKLLLLGSIVVLILIFLKYGGSIVAKDFNPHDDYHAYLVLPSKMLQLGSMSIDPFLGRRLPSLGGQSFLDTFVLSIAAEKNLNLMDAGIGLIIAIGIFWGLFKEKNLSNNQAIFLILLFLIIKTDKINITSVIIALALFVSLYRLLNSSQIENESLLKKTCLIALVSSAFFTLKSNLIIPGVLLITLTYLLKFFNAKNKRKIIYEFGLLSGLITLFLLPWMISLYQSSGTLLYPFLGKGFEGSVYGGTYLSPSSELNFLKALQIIGKIFTSLDFLGFILLSCIVLKDKKFQWLNTQSSLPLIISTGLSVILLSLAVGGHNVGKDGIALRYAVSFLLPTIIILITIIWENNLEKNLRNLTQSKFKSIIISVFITGLLFTGIGDESLINFNISNIRLGLSKFDFISQEDRSKYQNLLINIPPQEKVLARLEKPFLLNFKNHQIFLIDMPGFSSLPPGMPFFKGSSALADYLTSKSIKYVAYSYAKEAGFSLENYEWMLDPNKSSTWYRIDAKHTFDFQDNLIELSKTRKKIYDDGENFVLELQK